MSAELLFRSHDALLEGHFLLSSGLHSDRYLQCALVLSDPEAAESLGEELAASAVKIGPAYDLVVSPAMGGLIIGQEVARALGLRHYFAERVDGVMTMRRGFRVEPGESVLVVEDVVTTGKSTKEVFALVKAAGASIGAAASIIDRSEGRAELGVPYASLWEVAVPAWTPEQCPRCKAGEPFVKPGSRTEKKNG